MPTIVVLVKNVPDSWSEHSLNPDYTLDRESVTEVIDEINEYAVEKALALRDSNEGFRVVALSAGPERAEDALRKALAMGADEAVLLVDDALKGSDALGTAWDGATGALPGIIAEYRQIPALTSLRSCDLVDGKLTGIREVMEGEYTLEAPLPVLVSVTEKSDKPRFANFQGIRAAKAATIRHLSLADIGVAPEHVGLAHAATTVHSAETCPERSQGQIVVDHGDVATVIADFLAAEKFI